MEKYLKRLCKAIITRRFNDENYRQEKSWYGHNIQTQPLFCSYGQIGFDASVTIDGTHFGISFDWELKELTIDDTPWKDFINLLYLEDNDIRNPVPGSVWDEHPRSVELECYTDAGEDMIIDLEEPTKKCLQKYIDDFRDDIDYKVDMWWPNGEPGRGVPFANIKEHYEDYEDYLKWLQKICNKMPY